MEFVEKWNLGIQLTMPVVKGYRWSPPPPGCILSDGSLYSESAGYGAILRDSDGDAIALGAGSSSMVSILHHELQGIHLGLSLALKQHCSRVVIATDSMGVSSL